MTSDLTWLSKAVTCRRIDDPDEALQLLDQFLPVYRIVNREAPYLEDENDVQAFASSWPRRVGQPGFRLALAEVDGQAVGYGFGHQLVVNTRWWKGATGPLDVDTAEVPGRTFAVIEFAVLAEFRRQGIGHRLHALLLSPSTEERVTLLVRTEDEAAPARALYAGLGYRRVGEITPFEGAPTYAAMVRDRES
ncbi:GNAT family N-acetyltransferase [Cryptosporangium sp. NPDC051539]|uniref:GNAT family N-acetyltransferase n=1 Tax=Cryptosporangium sp. NPDC051539 TaxID=3363962 RepID=UPI0037AF9C9A